ncbi:MAG: class I mannose-6-phosphate isomerase [Chloroflexi bacterium]|nr:class I mannose-6-phosphate isomerase [Chloroflexota bacterium]
MTPLYPLRLNPALHVRVWGGRRLQTVFHKALPTDEPYGESWEVHDTATVADGPLAGQTLGALLATCGHDLIGPDNDPAAGFPLLLKLMDARDWLSVQVHPNDEQARQLEGEPRGKTEAWLVLDAEPGARLVIGVQPGTTRAALAEAIRQNTLQDRLVYAEVTAGDLLLNNAGAIHALGPGLLIYEIQQSSDTTYRLYDWGRLGLDGKPRALHIEKGVAVANLDTLPEIRHTAGDERPQVELVRCPYFTTIQHRLTGDAIMLDTGGRRFDILTALDGQAAIVYNGQPTVLSVGQTALIPASLGAYTLSGPARVLRSFQTLD